MIALVGELEFETGRVWKRYDFTIMAIQVSMSPLKGASTGPKQAVLKVSARGSVVAQAMLFTLIK